MLKWMLVAFAAFLSMAYTTGPIWNSVAVCNPQNPTQCQQPDGSGNTPVSVSQAKPGVSNGTNADTSFRYSYRAVNTGFTPAATATDFAGICGSSTKVIYVNYLGFTWQSTAAAVQTIYYIHRSTADTGGTPTTQTAVPDDLSNPTATATLVTFGANPTLGTSAGTSDIIQTASSATTAAGAANQVNNIFGAATPLSFNQPYTLRGTGDCLYVNYNGAAVTSGLSGELHASWVEGPGY